MSLRLINIKEIKEDKLFYSGSVFRKYGAGMNVETVYEDYYDYMLVNLPWEAEYLTLVNITPHNSKAGSVLSSVKIDATSGSKAVRTGAIKASVGDEDLYYIVPLTPVVKYGELLT